MKIISALIPLVMLSFSPHAQTAETPAIERARQEVERVRALVDVGAMPQATLDKAQKQLGEAEDEMLLSERLYGKASVDDLTQTEAEEMVEAAERQVALQQQRVNEVQTLVDEGVTARLELTPVLEELQRRQQTVELAKSRLKLLVELTRMAESEDRVALAEAEGEDDDDPSVRPAMEKFLGDGSFTTAEFRNVRAAYEKEFSTQLPITAFGMTAVHRQLGFDHRGRVDVGLNPDQEEGRWLLTYLREHDIPYYAFRAAIPGVATGVHIHMGPGSMRIRSAKARPVRTARARHAD